MKTSIRNVKKQSYPKWPQPKLGNIKLKNIWPGVGGVVVVVSHLINNSLKKDVFN
jgi:hypothetical protein